VTVITMATYPDASTTFIELMALSRLPGPEAAYMSLTPAWASGGRWNAFGGCVYAQAVWAAAQEVAEGMVVHVWYIQIFLAMRGFWSLFCSGGWGSQERSLNEMRSQNSDFRS
jgi:hypothetical protein